MRLRELQEDDLLGQTEGMPNEWGEPPVLRALGDGERYPGVGEIGGEGRFELQPDGQT